MKVGKYLIVDDDEIFGSVLQRALQRRGLYSVVAKDIFSALQQAEQYNCSHAIIDLKLAQESGLTLIRELKKGSPNLQIVMLTGYSSISTAVEAIKLGAINYLCKPADADEILAAFNIEIQNSNNAEILYAPLSIERLEWEHIQKILQENQGNVSATARILGMHRRTLQRKLQKRPVKQ
jgi:two-component system response regulator RegA